MKIELEEPYKSDWKHGYIVTNKENRKHVILYNSPNDRSTVSYARYLMACSIGNYIDVGFEVDHIDNDKTNDVVSNLQILTKKENLDKSNPKLYNVYVCPICGVEFTPKRKQWNRPNPCCSRRCGAIKSYKTKISNLNEL